MAYANSYSAIEIKREFAQLILTFLFVVRYNFKLQEIIVMQNQDCSASILGFFG